MGGPKQRAVLALLLRDADRVVPAEYLAEALRRGAPPAGRVASAGGRPDLADLHFIPIPIRRGKPFIAGDLALRCVRDYVTHCDWRCSTLGAQVADYMQAAADTVG